MTTVPALVRADSGHVTDGQDADEWELAIQAKRAQGLLVRRAARTQR